MQVDKMSHVPRLCENRVVSLGICEVWRHSQNPKQRSLAGMLIRLATSSARTGLRQHSAAYDRAGETPAENLSDVPQIGNIPDLQPVLVPNHQQLLLLARLRRSRERDFAECRIDYLVVCGGSGGVLCDLRCVLRGVWMRHV